MMCVPGCRPPPTSNLRDFIECEIIKVDPEITLLDARMTTVLRINQNIQINEDEIQFEFVRSSGPGGQNVNKVATAVQLRFDVAGSPSLSGPVKERLTHLAGNRITNEGVLILEGHEHRTQEQNKAAVMERLRNLIRKAAEKPRVRKPTRPSAAARTRRLEEKRRRSQTKRDRRSDGVDW